MSMIVSTYLLPDVTFKQTKLPDQQRIPVRSFEFPDSFNSESQYLVNRYLTPDSAPSPTPNLTNVSVV